MKNSICMRTRFITICIALVALVTQANAQQSLVWKKHLPNPYAGKYYQVCTDAQNNVYSVIDIPKAGASNNQARRIYKSNQQGDTLWSVITEDNILDLIIDNTGNVYASGNIKVGLAYKATVLKINATGALQWDNIYLDAEHSFDEASDIEVDDTDGSIYIAVRDYALNGYNATSKSHIFTLAKISTAGTQLWKYSFAGPLKNDMPNGYKRVFLDASKNPLIICNFNINPTYPLITTAVYAAKFNAAGIKQWDTLVRSTNSANPNLMVNTNCTEAILDASNDLIFTGDSAINRLKYGKISGANGAILYTRTFGAQSASSSYNRQLVQGNKPYIVIAKTGKANLYEIGATGDTTLKLVLQSPDPTYKFEQLKDTKRINNKLYLNYRIFEAIPPQGNNINRFMMIRINETNFQQDWSMDYGTPYGVNNYFWADATDNVYVSRDTSGAGNVRTFITEKHNSNIQNALGINDHVQSKTIGLYPNPAGDEINLDLDGLNDLSEIAIYNSQLQLQAVIKGDKRTIGVSVLPQGFYVLRVSTQGKAYSGTFIKK